MSDRYPVGLHFISLGTHVKSFGHSLIIPNKFAWLIATLLGLLTVWLPLIWSGGLEVQQVALDNAQMINVNITSFIL